MASHPSDLRNNAPGRRSARRGPLVLETGTATVYCPGMIDGPASTTPGPAGWRESLARSKAQIAAGESVPLLPVLDRLRVSAERLEAEQGVTADGERIATAGGGR